MTPFLGPEKKTLKLVVLDSPLAYHPLQEVCRPTWIISEFIGRLPLLNLDFRAADTDLPGFCDLAGFRITKSLPIPIFIFLLSFTGKLPLSHRSSGLSQPMTMGKLKLTQVKLSEAEEASVSTPPWWVAVLCQPPPGRDASSRVRRAKAR